jgi:leucine dehydrogenase
MTYKAAAADLPFGGGKAVILADPHSEKTESLLRAFGRFVDWLGGLYLTGTDLGSTDRDMEVIRLETSYVAGLPEYGDSATLTGLGVYCGMKACAHEVWGSDSLVGRTVAIQGFGKVAAGLVHHLVEEGADIVVCDTHEPTLALARDLGLRVLPAGDIYGVDCDIFSPCAVGRVINGDTIPRLKCRIIAGGANDQLLTDVDGDELHRRGILYAPDYIVNAGGLILTAAEFGAKLSLEWALRKNENIHDTMVRVIETSKRLNIPTSRAADLLAEERLATVHAAA